MKKFWCEKQQRDLLVIVTDLGVVSILGYEKEKHNFEVILKEELPSCYPNRIAGHHLAVSKLGWAVMIGAMDIVKHILALEYTSDKGISVKKKWTFTNNTLIFDIGVLGTSGYSAAHCMFASLENAYVKVHPDKPPLHIPKQKIVIFDLNVNELEITTRESPYLRHQANHLISVPQKKGILICSENCIAYYSYRFSKLKQCPIPKRLTNSKEDVIIACSAVCFENGKSLILAQSEQGDIFKITLLGTELKVKEIIIEYFDTIPVASSLCIIGTTYLFAASEFGNHHLYAIKYAKDVKAVLKALFHK
ncbi:splicing factor 3B subunit 3 [Trichonephila inaurata madagascariensis]|uniref:Splicing factor 3B subunit 3 n=1 Tax=Trichonephila inaurata madagascariensis TaxID=2747483 RepID=A0A8X6MBG4_9ARAC|nr:splicing factor 3B subunit 3 [Trichonephila inaurata madagascariensis]